MFTDSTPKLTFRKLTEPYRFYNYAILHSLGLAQVLDVMRYNRAFLGRASDAQILQKQASEGFLYGGSSLGRVALLLVKYDWKGITRPNWAYDHLMAEQELEEIRDPIRLVELSSDSTNFQAKPTLKYEATCEAVGPVSWLIEVMYQNHATPATEEDARSLEAAIDAGDPLAEVSMKLQNYMAVEGKWSFPPKPQAGAS